MFFVEFIQLCLQCIVLMMICMICHLCGVCLWWKMNVDGPYSLKGIVHVKIKMLFTHPYCCILCCYFFWEKKERNLNVQIFSRQRKFVVITSRKAPKWLYLLTVSYAAFHIFRSLAIALCKEQAIFWWTSIIWKVIDFHVLWSHFKTENIHYI